MKTIIYFLIFFFVLNLFSQFIEEQGIVELSLTGPLAERYSEISGLTWFEDWLILLPQYPHLFGEEGALFYLKKEDIKLFLSNKLSELNPQPISFSAASDYTELPGFEGFEAIAFHENTAYLAIESSPEQMLGYLGKAVLDKKDKTLFFDSENLVLIQPQTAIPNACYESMLIQDEKVFLFYEANGKNVNPKPQAYVYDLNLEFLYTVSFPNIEYRITDATQPQNGIVWMINYFWPGERNSYKPADDTIKKQFGYGTTHSGYEHVERIVAFTWKNGSFEMADESPVYIQLEEAARNWEGIVRFEEGFIIATDKHPRTIVAFVKARENR